MKKTLKCLALTFSLVVGSLFIGAALPQKANAATGDTITFKKNVIAYEAANSTYNFIPTGNAADNRRALNYLIEGNEPKTININNDISIDTYLRPGNNTTINAGDHTITSGSGVIINDPTAASYDNFKNLTINGGVWKISSSSGLKGTMMRISYASNISINDATVYCNYTGHGIELIACNGVSINGCKLIPQGKCPKKCVEEQLQIDLATPKTAPGLYRLSPKLCNGTPSKNISVTNCIVSGARGICASFPGSEAKYRKAGNYHSNITIENCTITGKSAEALALFNTTSATVKNCRVTTKTPLKRNSYSVGLAVAYQKGSSPKTSLKNKVVIENNIVKGGRQGIFVFSHTSKKFGNVIVKKNRAYARSGKRNAIRVISAKKKQVSKNKTKKW